MRSQALLVVAALTLGAGCGKKAPSPPPRETVLQLLQQEAQSMKTEGEKVDPSLGVATNWNIDAVEVNAREGDAERPYTGVIKFSIITRSRDVTEASGAVSDKLEKQFRYAYSMATNKWQMTP